MWTGGLPTKAGHLTYLSYLPPCKQALINIYHINNNKAFTRKHEIAGFQCHAIYNRSK